MYQITISRETKINKYNYEGLIYPPTITIEDKH